MPAQHKDQPLLREVVDGIIAEIADFQPQLSAVQVNESDPPRSQIASREKHSQNSLSQLPALQLTRLKPLMLTLHCLFPNDLLPALDILDRRLVQRLVHSDQDCVVTAPATEHNQTTENLAQASHNEQYPNKDDNELPTGIFLVASASTLPLHHGPSVPSSTSTIQEPEKGYEVRLHAWNCTCPTFTLSAFRDLRSHTETATEHHSRTEILQDREGPGIYPFGGTLTCATDRGLLPVCKHILACILFARCPGLFGDDTHGNRLVSAEELAGWCAGWGG